MLSSFGGNSGSTKFLNVFSNKCCSIDSRELSAMGNVLKILYDLSIIALKFTCALA